MKNLTFTLVAFFLFAGGWTRAADRIEYLVLATTKTSTMEKEMNQAAENGYRFATVMGGETAVAGSEVVVVMVKQESSSIRAVYKLLATSKTSTMQKEMQQLGDEGFDYKGQTVFKSTFGGEEVVVIMELDKANRGNKITYRLLATSKTSTMQKELREAGGESFLLVGTTVGKTAFGGSEVICIMKKQ